MAAELQPPGAALAVIDALPDPMIGLWEMEEYGYLVEGMLPLAKETALESFDRDHKSTQCPPCLTDKFLL